MRTVVSKSSVLSLCCVIAAGAGGAAGGGCGGSKGKAAKTAGGDMPPSVDCGRVVEALAAQLEGPSVLLVGGTSGVEEPRIVGDLACQVAASGRPVVVAVAKEDRAKSDLSARIDAMKAAGLDVALADPDVKGLVSARPDAKVIVLAADPAVVKDVPAYAISVVGASGAGGAPALRENPAKEGGFDAVLDLSAPVVEQPQEGEATPEAPAPETQEPSANP